MKSAHIFEVSPDARNDQFPPRVASSPYDLVAIAASAGGIPALITLLAALPADFPVPIAIVQHRTTALPNLLPNVLGRKALLTVKFAQDSDNMRPGIVYLAPPHLHLIVRPDHTFGLSNGSRIRHVLSSANPLFSSAARVLKERVIAVVLTGMDSDGTDGVQSVRAAGGVVFAQDQASCAHFEMPRSAIQTGCVNRVLPLEDIAPALVGLVTGKGFAAAAANSKE